MIRSFIDAEPLALFSALPPDIRRARLDDTLGSRLSLFPIRRALSPTGSFVGYVKGKAIHVRQQIWYRNSLQRPFYGRLTADGTGTRIGGCFRVPPGYAIGNAAAMILVPVVFLCLVLVSPEQIGGRRGAVVVAPMFLASMWLAIRIGRSLAAGGPAAITRFLVTTLDAKIVPPRTQSGIRTGQVRHHASPSRNRRRPGEAASLCRWC